MALEAIGIGWRPSLLGWSAIRLEAITFFEAYEQKFWAHTAPEEKHPCMNG